jgi:cytochrome c553
MITTKTLTCPSCDADLRVATTLPPGKRITCPSCESPFRIPEEEDASPAEITTACPRKAAAPRVEEPDEERPALRKQEPDPRSEFENLDGDEDELPAPRKQKSAPRSEFEDLDDEDEPPAPRKRKSAARSKAATADGDEDERPAPRKKPGKKQSKKSGSNTPLLVGLCGGAVLVIGASVALIVVFGTGKKKTEKTAAAAADTGRPGTGQDRPGGGGGRPRGGDRPRDGRPGPGAGGGTENPGPAGGTSSQLADGRQVYDSNRCSRCHRIGGAGGRRGPDLSRVGATHPADWLSEHVRSPKSHRPDSTMPAFGRLQPADLRALGEYLASLK